MTTGTQPEREIRLSEIPTELRNLRDEVERWRACWAQDGTKYRQQVRELTEALNQARAARDAARQTCDDLTTHCEGQGRMIAVQQDKIARLNAELNRSMCRADVLAQWIEECKIGRDDLELLIGNGGGIECPECQGEGQIDTFDDVMVGDYHTTRDVSVDCPEPGCVRGKVLR